MKDTIEYLNFFTSKDPQYAHLNAFYFDVSGHVIATNGYVLMGSKRPFNIKFSGKGFRAPEYLKGELVEIEKDFLKWKKCIPEESAKKICISIPTWFKKFQPTDEEVIMTIDYKDIQKPFIKLTSKINETSFAFDAKYLSVFAGKEIQILILDSYGPKVIVDKNSLLDPFSKNFKEDVLREEWFYLLMPINLEKEVESEVYL
ncbi:MAG: hypothetical protein A2381_18470 [Bdellovibrionales bacterium RIFOXYB1_FULL_37_110]|nr:MAG: hypothetical protein A2417_01300 [Bdellovibrionales bacterium RIFOXYC1_FULL_37_79]OFZ59016.1 MAG: hypothetical protein A2381_18470 [Bdellovibrionales bacterium RIFOXYB1_FULL_37_110]OFZ65121.1 MAG: hypothetical protein A2577_04785 [Bdellovibrionales bacterium RIFOXYD1_FULL_36_51]